MKRIMTRDQFDEMIASCGLTYSDVAASAKNPESALRNLESSEQLKRSVLEAAYVAMKVRK